MYGVPLRHVVLVLLTVQNAGAVLLMRYTRSIPGETEFITQTAVIMQETLKGLACVLILFSSEGTVKSAWAQPAEALKTAVPALLYLGQNNLQYVAVGLLDAATYTVSRSHFGISRVKQPCLIPLSYVFMGAMADL